MTEENSQEIRRELEETRARIDQDIDALQYKLKRTTDPATYADPTVLPVVAAVIGVVVGLVALLRRRRQNEPPRPDPSSRRGEVAALFDRAEEEGLLNDEARKVLVGLLTAQGAKWLQSYMADEGRRVAGAQAERVGEAAATLRSTATDGVTAAAESATERAGALREQAASAAGDGSAAVQERAAAATERASETGSDLVERLSQAVETIGERLDEARERAADALPDQPVERVKEAARAGAETVVAKEQELVEGARERAADLKGTGETALTRGRVKAAEAEIRARYEAERQAALAEAEAEAGKRRLMGRARSLFSRN